MTMPDRTIVRPALPFLLLFLSVTLIPASACRPARAGALEPPAVDIGLLEQEIVAKLSGQVEIQPGLKLSARSTLEDKNRARAYLIDVWKGLGLAVQTQDYSAEGRNIFAAVGPADPGAETLVFGAHYDSARNTPGANDNATGTALVTAAAARLSRLSPLGRRLVFVLFDEEERGLRGSRAFAQKLKDENTRVHSVHTVDQMGWDKDADRAVELELPYEGALDLYAAEAARMNPPVPLLVTKEAGSDHSAFRRLGYKAVGLTEEYRSKDTTPFIHRPGDTAGTVDFAYLANTTDLVLRVWTALARGR